MCTVPPQPLPPSSHLTGLLPLVSHKPAQLTPHSPTHPHTSCCSLVNVFPSGSGISTRAVHHMLAGNANVASSCCCSTSTKPAPRTASSSSAAVSPKRVAVVGVARMLVVGSSSACGRGEEAQRRSGSLQCSSAGYRCWTKHRLCLQHSS